MITALLYLSPSTRRACSPERETDQGKPSGFTLVELMVAMCVSLMLLGGVVSLFGTLGESVNDSKSNSEMLQTMRHAARQLQSDLGNVSLVPNPAQTMVDPQGFFEYVEGPANDRVPYSDEPEEVQLPDPIILDDGGSSFTAVSDGSNNIFKPWNSFLVKQKSYGMTVHEKNAKYLFHEGLFEATGLASGTYKVSLTWPTEWWTGDWASQTETSVPVSVSSGGAAPQATTVDQSQAPSSFDDPEGEVNGFGDIIKWQDIGEVDVTNGEITVQIGPCGQGYEYIRVFADAIRIECLELTGGGTGEGQVAQMSLTGDCDDVLHFTTKKDDGAYEVVWFLTPMAGTPKNSDGTANSETRYRLHRRELKVDPHAPTTTESLSLGWVNAKADEDPTDPERAANSLESLSLRYNRNAHAFSETGQFEPNTIEHYKTNLESEFTDDDGNDRTGKTVILENVIAFDVQAYDPAVPIYSTTSDGQTVSLLPTDPGWQTAHQVAKQAAEDQGLASIFDLSPPPTDVGPIGSGAFRDLGTSSLNLEDNQTSFQKNSDSPLILSDATGSTYDSWSGDYVKPGDVGFDNPPEDGIVDTAEDLRKPPPYDAPLKAVQVEIRMQEPESGKVRSVKVRKFLGKR